MKLTLQAKILIMIVATLMMVAIYFHLISWRASMVSDYNGLPGGEMLVPLVTLFLLNIK